jgi:hypothetical protein
MSQIDSDASNDEDDRDPAQRRRDRGITKEMDDLDCHDCQTPISPNTGIHADGWSYRGGTCPNCRFGDAARVDVDPDAISDRRKQRLAQKRRSPQAQSCFQAALFLDQQVPAGRYVIRRVTAHTVQVQLPDDIDQDARHALADRYKNATKTSGERVWYVQSFPDRINLVDFQFGTQNEGEKPLVTANSGP